MTRKHTGAVVISVVLCLALVSAPTAHAGSVSPLPESDYGVRSVCGAPTPGHASCLALELVPETRAARAHTRPVGMPRAASIRAGNVAEVCKPPTAAEGCYGLRPPDLHSAYALPTTVPSEQTIALVDAYDDHTAEADLEVYDEAFHLSSCTTGNGCFAKVNEKGKPSPLPAVEGGWAVEISLDVEVAHAICESCHILLVEASDATNVSLDAAEEAAARLGASEISNSWATAEPPTDSAVFNHPGVAITAAAGDDGYLNWDTPYPQARGLVSYPASSPHVTAVGGTRLSLNAGGGWVGETVWNGGAHTLAVSRGAGGGGCSSRFPAPFWQQELPNWGSVGCESTRAVADVSADADPYTGVAIYDSTPVPVEEGFESLGWGPIGGKASLPLSSLPHSRSRAGHRAPNTQPAPCTKIGRRIPGLCTTFSPALAANARKRLVPKGSPAAPKPKRH
jgi:hypothetical protein